MKLVRMDPPGTWCQNHALFERIDESSKPLRFLEVGCGDGSVSRALCERGHAGVGIDFSETSLAAARKNLAPFIAQGRYDLVAGDFLAYRPAEPRFDLAVSMMVMEHVEDDAGFVNGMNRCLRPGGQLVIGVPGRRDCWGLEDETVGHLRRYDRQDLQALLGRSGLSDIAVWSVAFPTANLLRRIGNFLIARSGEREKIGQTDIDQTKQSGVRDIPFKTAFPSPFGLLLNQYAMWPLCQLQRAFYNTDLGVTLIGTGRTAA